MPVNNPRITLFEKRWTMPDRKYLILAVQSACLLILACVALNHALRFPTELPRRDRDCQNLCLPCTPPTSHWDTAKPLEVVFDFAVDSPDNEEQDRADAQDELPVSSLLPGAFRHIAPTWLNLRRAVLPVYPLRC